MIVDYYAILGVSPNASTVEIKQAYRHLVRLHHPDLNTQAQDAQMKRLNQAYEVLRDPRKRAAYDEQRRQAQLQREQLRQEQAEHEPKMTWMQGMIGFVRELKKELQSE